MTLFVRKEKPGRNVLFLGALGWKHVILILMYCLLSAIKNKSSGNTRWKDVSWHLQIILSPHSVVLTFQSAFFSVSERKKHFYKFLRSKMWNTLPSLLYHSYFPKQKVHNLVWWYSRRLTHKVDGWLKFHFSLVTVFVLCTKVSHTFWAYKLSMNLFWRHFQHEC